MSEFDVFIIPYFFDTELLNRSGSVCKEKNVVEKFSVGNTLLFQLIDFLTFLSDYAFARLEYKLAP